MGIFDELFGPQQAPYGTAQVGVPGATAATVGDGQCATRYGLFNRLFGPALVPYNVMPLGVSPTAPALPAPASLQPAPSGFVPVRVLRAFATSPEILSVYAEGHEALVAAQAGGEVLTQRLKSFDSQPLTLFVPEGCDTLELSFGVIEPTPGVGAAEDLDELIALGRPRVSTGVIERGLVAGDQISIVVPWRAAAWVDMPAGRLRAKVIATFSRSQS